MWYVYILECGNRSLYTGVTSDLDRRLDTHTRAKGGHYTKSFGVRKLIYHETYQARIQAFQREAQIKGWTRRKKLTLVKNDSELLKKL